MISGVSPAPEDPAPSRPVVLFDGVCNLCNSAVQWLIARDPEGRFAFASLQSRAAHEVLAAAGVEDTSGLPDSIVLVDPAGVHVRSAAALRIAGLLGFPYNLARIAFLVPRPLRDAVYRLIARHRYRWFGRRDVCMLPTPELAARFLDAGEPRAIVSSQEETASEPVAEAPSG
jgi:predicted DCC family thiol-disulfide oxidoreductase YuxK